jgi:23S rRNA pseudouridine1911/1915/1917 synthase
LAPFPRGGKIGGGLGKLLAARLPHVSMSDPKPCDEPIQLIVSPDEAGARFDSYLAIKFPSYSRVHLRRVINAAAAKINGKREKAAHRLQAGDRVTVILPELPRKRPQPENIPLSILYEDDSLLAVDKPPGMVVHPARGHWTGTLVSALEYHVRQLSTIGGPTRAGIVHRLDRDTSGVVLVAKNDQAHMHLSRQFEERRIEKEYFAIVAGRLDRDRDWIDEPIGLHPRHREKMAIRHDAPDSRAAQSFYEVVERFDGFAAVRVLPKTGRTHQIRVHLASVGAPILCDKQYGGRSEITLGEIAGTSDSSVLLARQALHARRLTLTHPVTGERLTIESPLPDDLCKVLAALRAHRGLVATKGPG